MARVEGERPLDWVGSSKKDFMTFPETVKDDMGYALGLAQLGGTHPAAKPWKGQGPGVFELYTVRFKKVVYVLHAFQKKSPKGIKTAKTDADLIARRLRAAQQAYEDHHGKGKF